MGWSINSQGIKVMFKNIFICTFCFLLSGYTYAKSIDYKMYKSCGNAKFLLKCDVYNGILCKKSNAYIITGSQNSKLSNPVKMEKNNYFALGIACVDEKYIILSYSEIPVSCEECENYYLYTTKGKLMKGQSDKKGFEQLYKKMNIKSWPEFDYLNIGPVSNYY